MATKSYNGRDLSKVEHANPTKVIEQHYEELMAEDDPEKLARDVIELVEKHGGVSAKNFARFKVTVAKEKGNLVRLKTYITNFVLAGCGLGVLDSHLAYA